MHEVELPCTHGTEGPAVTTILSYVQVPEYTVGEDEGLEVGSAVVGLAVTGGMVPVQGPTVDQANFHAPETRRGAYASMGQNKLMG